MKRSLFPLMLVVLSAASSARTLYGLPFLVPLAMLAAAGLETLPRPLERLLVPPVLPGASDAGRDGARVDDFRRVIAFVAVAAVGFFPISLAIANVPVEKWLLFLVAAGGVGASALATRARPEFARGSPRSRFAYALKP